MVSPSDEQTWTEITKAMLPLLARRALPPGVMRVEAQAVRFVEQQLADMVLELRAFVLGEEPVTTSHEVRFEYVQITPRPLPWWFTKRMRRRFMRRFYQAVPAVVKRTIDTAATVVYPDAEVPMPELGRPVRLVLHSTVH